MSVGHPHDAVIVGAGLCGLAAASELGDRAVVLERDDRPGGLVRTDRIGDHWFDRVLHLLHLSDPVMEERIKGIVGDVLQPCPPRASVVLPSGTARFPIQFHLGMLDAPTRDRCLRDFELAWATAPEAPEAPARDYEDLLLRSFGRAMCDEFFFPYNEKQWRRPLSTLAPSGFQWNVQVPSLDDVRRGALPDPVPTAGYNAHAFYPRPPAGSPVRGMEVVSVALAALAHDVRYDHAVVEIDTVARSVTARHGNDLERFRFDTCISTAPLPWTIATCTDVPDDLRAACAALEWNVVYSVAICIRGPRPCRGDHWRYYPRRDVCFTRTIDMCAFDEDAAPPDGWSLLVEIPDRKQAPHLSASSVVDLCVRDLRRVGVLTESMRIEDVKVMVADPAYVVFGLGSEQVVNAARSFLVERGVIPLGRYGSWEYSSMEHAIRAGFECAGRI